jgi:D-arabinose 1-dehydrogenase-like Zn-dependent alcohol dehydrogenase
MQSLGIFSVRATVTDLRKGNISMKRMKVAQISKPRGDWELVERDIPEPGDSEVRIKVEACGICHSDMLVKDGLWPGLKYPRIPGHEIAGRIDALGSRVGGWKVGQRVGVGWHGGHCFVCEPCRRGHFILCKSEKITGISHDGGYAEYMISPAEAVAAMPEDLPAAEAAPLLCAGITVFNSLRNSGAKPGDLVAVQGVGGLGHLGIQYAHRMGFETVALNRGADKQPLAAKLGARHYIDSRKRCKSSAAPVWRWRPLLMRSPFRRSSADWRRMASCWWSELPWNHFPSALWTSSEPAVRFKVGLRARRLIPRTHCDSARFPGSGR